MWASQEFTVVKLYHACRPNRLGFLLEVILSKADNVEDHTTAEVIQLFNKAGVCPDWWKLEPMLTDAAWQRTIDAIKQNDSNTRGLR